MNRTDQYKGPPTAQQVFNLVTHLRREPDAQVRSWFRDREIELWWEDNGVVISRNYGLPIGQVRFRNRNHQLMFEIAWADYVYAAAKEH